MLKTLPFPPFLALPLINSTAQVAVGDTVVKGQLLADGNQHGVDLICPVDGVIVDDKTTAMASDENPYARSLIVKTSNERGEFQSPTLNPSPPFSLPTLKQANINNNGRGEFQSPTPTFNPSPSIPTILKRANINNNGRGECQSPTLNPSPILKRAGIVGLGGGVFPAWKKWRQNLFAVIINGLQTNPRLQADQALLESLYHSDVCLPTVFQTIADAFGAPVTVALRDNILPEWQHPIVTHLNANYADGSERLLIKKLLGVSIPLTQTPADVGVVTFNIATALAIYNALAHRLALSHRVVTVILSAQDIYNINVPLGSCIADIEQFLQVPSDSCSWYVGDAPDPLPVSAVIHAQTAVLSTAPVALSTAPPMACIRCGYCAQVCPSQLAPWHLYHLSQNDESEALAKARLNDCILCRQCDEVCPSNIPLATVFKSKKHALKKAQEKQVLQEQWQSRFNQHTIRQLHKKNKNWASRDVLKSLLHKE